MLTICKPLNAGQAQTYHAKEFTSPDQNYWQKGDISLGEWQGQLAETFGLSGPIDAEHFARLSEVSTRSPESSWCVTGPFRNTPPRQERRSGR